MKIEDIELHVGEVDFPFKPVRELRARCEASHAFMPAPTENDINAKLRGMAAKVGANAVINIKYNSGVSMTSWKSMTGTGLAVIRESDTVACPHCAEMIRRAAIKCRFCGEPVTPAPALETAHSFEPDQAGTYENSADQPPLEETNNPVLWIVVASVFVFIMVIIAVSS